MYVIRSITANDGDNMFKLAMSATLGVTSLPKNRASLEKKLERTLKSFHTDITEPKNELYLFLLEDLATGNVGGICGIESVVGTENPTHFLRIETNRPLEDAQHPEIKVLHPVTYINGPSEICSLFLMKDFRQSGLGKLLSFSRFLFIASNPKRFNPIMTAEMRGVINDKHTSPFWDGVGKHFFQGTFKEAMELRDQGEFQLSDVIPDFPIYISLLPKNAQRVISKVHTNTKAALKMLKEQGFRLSNEIDLFDGGPKLEAITSEIKTVKKSVLAKIASLGETQGKDALISNNALNFRACMGLIEKKKNGTVIINTDVADALQVGVGDTIRYYLNKKKGTPS